MAQARSFSQGARELGMSPQAASKQVMLLERMLGVRLLHRTTQKVGLTREGGSSCWRSASVPSNRSRWRCAISMATANTWPAWYALRRRIRWRTAMSRRPSPRSCRRIPTSRSSCWSATS
ncbi:helix-turn-helix domain-containing protein [Cupriavidus sp. H18C1]|uniref:helix-turn-helix domain-containing protein n=1 Tax=Cupriavidus sp. H18C1 TaxID=3241601 RepID=UPI003BB89E47